MWDGRGCAAANTKQAKAALAGVQKKLGQMEDAVIRLTGEKDALAHRMKVGRMAAVGPGLARLCWVLIPAY